jgi:hypothetical protein
MRLPEGRADEAWVACKKMTFFLRVLSSGVGSAYHNTPLLSLSFVFEGLKDLKKGVMNCLLSIK